MRPNTSIVKSLRSTCSVHQVNRVTNVSGGCINEAKKYETDNGDYFIKQNSDKGSFEMFQAELLGLQTILETNSIQAPKPLVVDRLEDDGAFLIMEYTDIARLTKEASVKLGEQLAVMHKHPATLFGFDVDNTIGSTPQINTNRTHDWVEFFTKWRLEYQLNLINEQYQDHDLHQLGMKLSKNIQQFFPPDLQVTPALLHGRYYFVF
jgi:fructosamine-3-kinase